MRVHRAGAGVGADHQLARTRQRRADRLSRRGLLPACLLGAVAGLYPATRAARLTPTEALRAT